MKRQKAPEATIEDVFKIQLFIKTFKVINLIL